jgi:serine/threonine protein kinase
MAETALQEGHILAGRYRLESRLGAGGMGAIWRAQHLVLNAPVAVKLIEREAVPDEETVARFLREAQAAAALRSPHVVQIFDYGIDGRVPFIVMELLDGENLSQRLKRVGRLTPADTARILTHVGRAVGRAHEANIIHRDLKPENVFLVRNEDEEIAKVLDFGVAKVAQGALGQEGTRTRTGSILGTPFYMSPEQAQGNKTVDYRSDLWSLGIIAFECMTGKRPFYSDGLGDLVLQICVRDIPLPSSMAPVPLGFDAWWQKVTARDPELRFQSAREMTDALREALGIETRETQATAPEIVISSGDPEPKHSDGPNDNERSGERTTTRASSLETRQTDPARRPSAGLPDVNAATVQIGPDELAALTDQKFAPSHAPDPEPGGNAGMIVGVAAVALAIGLVAGFMFLSRAQDDSARPLPDPLPPPEAASALGPRKKAEVEPAPDKAAEPETQTAEPAAEAQNTENADPDAGSTRAPAPAKADERPEGAAKTEPNAAPAPSVRPDAGWVKPAWAIPDEEPRRVAPIEGTKP